MSGSIVVVVSPLLNMINEEVKFRNSLDIRVMSISVIEPEEEHIRVELGDYCLVYGTPEAWFMNKRWQMLQNITTYLCTLSGRGKLCCMVGPLFS